MGNDTAEELLTPLLRQLNFWCESGIREVDSMERFKIIIHGMQKMPKTGISHVFLCSKLRI